MEKNKTKIITIAALVALVILIVGATYAYFVAQTGEGSQTDIRINANTVDTLTFETGDPITLTLDQENFAEGKGNQTGSTFAKAMLTANSKTNTATQNYYLYLSIYTNTFGYSINTDTPELILSIMDSNGNAITNLSSLTYKTVTDASGASISGYDITGVTGLLTILDNREITASPQKEEQWNITITMINYNEDQSKNAGKSFGAKVVVKKGGYNPTIADYCSDGENLKDCIVKYGNLGYDTSKITIHNASLANGAGDNSYRYSGSSGLCTFNGNNVQGAKSSMTFGLSNEEDCKNVYGVTSSGSNEMYLDNSITRLLTEEKSVVWENSACKTTDGESITYAFIFGKGFGAVTEDTCTSNSYLLKTDSLTARVSNLDVKLLGIGDWNSGANNFVCFGSTATSCPTDNLYRIIGVINDKVKLIKYDYATSDLLGIDGDYYGAYSYGNGNYKGDNYANIASYYWNYKATNKSTNTWSTSLLNKTNLNTNFLNNIGEEWANKIATTTWKVGGNTYDNVVKAIPSVTYQNEIVSPNATNSTDNATEYNAKIGLIYASDYGFAASPSAWTTTLYDYDGNDANGTSIKTINWMYMGLHEWTISRNSDYSNNAFVVDYDGSVYYYGVSNKYGVRPSFNLESSVNYVSGSGSMSDPIRVG